MRTMPVGGEPSQFSFQPEAKEPPVDEQRIRKRIAVEWLSLLISLAIGSTVLPAIVILIVSKELDFGDFGRFWGAVFSGKPDAIEITLAPYVVFQLVRSIIWAARTAKGK